MKKLILLIAALFIGVSAASTMSIADEGENPSVQNIEKSLNELMDEKDMSLEDAVKELLKKGDNQESVLEAALNIDSNFDFTSVLEGTASGREDSDNGDSDSGDSRGEGTSAPGAGGGGGGGAVSN